MKNNKNISSWVFVILSLILLTTFSVKLRVDQYTAWQQEPRTFFVSDIPLMTTLDAYHWLKLAKDYKDGTYIIPKTLLPDFTQAPLLSFMLARLSPLFNNNMHKTGVFLMFVLPGLFVIPLFLYFHKLGAPSAGILGGMIGTAGLGYLSRTLVAWVDTDALNLFFPLLAAFFILLAANKKRAYSYLFSSLAGLNMLIFFWWYEHPGFTVIYFFVLISYLIVNRIENKTVLYSALIYVIAANPVNLWHGLSQLVPFFNYFIVGFAEAGELVFPKVASTISEAGRMPFFDLLALVLRPGLLSLIGLVSFVFFSISNWKKFIPLIPLCSLGFLAFVSSNRLAMYLTPLAGIGYGYLIAAAFKRLFGNTGTHIFLKEAAVYSLSFVSFFIITLKTPISIVPVPAVSSETYKAFVDFKDRLPEGSTIFTWWDYAYAIQEATGFTILHHGGNKGSLTTNFIARGFVSESQAELYNIIGITANGDPVALAGASKTHRELIAAIKSYKSPQAKDKLYLLFTEDMAGMTAVPAKFAAINLLGSWGPDIGAEKYKSFGDTFFNCRPSGKGNSISCGDVVIDMDKGLINNNVFIKKTIVVGDGYVSTEREYNHKEGIYLELFGKKNNNSFNIAVVKLLPERLYNTNINQIYLLGNFDRGLFEEVYTEFPFARLFRVKTK